MELYQGSGKFSTNPWCALNIRFTSERKINLWGALLVYSQSNMHSCKNGIVELLHSHTTKQSHWSSGSTICFPPGGGGRSLALGVHPHFWNWDLLLAILTTLVTLM
jgi:hypothetical protein